MTVHQARDSLGRVGAFLPNIPFAPAIPMTQQRDAVRRLERAGYRSAWVNEGVGGKDVFAQMGVLLAATTSMTLAAGVANVWARPPETAHGAAAILADAYPGRVVVGLGVGYPEQAAAVGRTFERPLSVLSDYVRRMSLPQAMTPALEAAYPLIVGANGPKMLALAGRVTDGAIPTLVTADYTREARRVLGPDKLLVIGLAVAVGKSRAAARPDAQRFATTVIARPGSPYAANLARWGFSAEELAEPSDRVVDAVLGYGDPEDIADAVRSHLDAGADHVRLSTTATDFGTAIDEYETVASAVLASK